ncbi:MAG TPA: hypothetical protein VFY38_03420 [Pseudonocardia sp.]|nr:hypothetical protein [Pseudonocardia sp.]
MAELRPGDPPLPDRYADAVRARRAELRGVRTLLLGGHRVEVRHCLTAARLVAVAELAAALSVLGRELRHHAAHADRAGRAALPSLAEAAVGRLVDRAVLRWSAMVLPGLRRLAAPVAPDAVVALRPVVTVLTRHLSITVPGPEPPSRALGALLAGASGGTWRLALLPVAVLPAVGLPALGGRAVLAPALGIALALLVAATRAHRVAADRARLRRWADEVTAAVRMALDTELARRLIDVERVAGAELDEFVARRLALVEAELRALAPAEHGVAG